MCVLDVSLLTASALAATRLHGDACPVPGATCVQASGVQRSICYLVGGSCFHVTRHVWREQPSVPEGGLHAESSLAACGFCQTLSSYPSEKVSSGWQSSDDTDQPSGHASPGPGAARVTGVRAVPRTAHRRGAGTRQAECDSTKDPSGPLFAGQGQGHLHHQPIWSLGGAEGCPHCPPFSNQTDLHKDAAAFVCLAASSVTPWLCDFPPAA